MVHYCEMSADCHAMCKKLNRSDAGVSGVLNTTPIRNIVDSAFRSSDCCCNNHTQNLSKKLNLNLPRVQNTWWNTWWTPGGTHGGSLK